MQWVLIPETDDHNGDGELIRNYRSAMAVGLREIQIVLNYNMGSLCRYGIDTQMKCTYLLLFNISPPESRGHRKDAIMWLVSVRFET
jgi:hypothetical protein